jgi:hypothetical protein
MPMKRFLRSFRRFFARFALVDEERALRDAAVHDLELRHSHRFYEHDRFHEKDFAATNHRLTELEDAAGTLRDLLDKGVGARADATLSQLWKRMERADARQAAALQQLASEVAFLREANEALIAALEKHGLIRPASPGDQNA